MPKAKLYADTAIVGGGILGALIAARAKELGAKVGVVGFRLRDRPNLRAESLRNQGLSQSGLRYLRHPKVARIMRASRVRLLDFCAMRAPEVTGVIQMPSAQRDAFFSEIAGTPYERETRELTVDQARAALGRVWVADACSVSVPEQQLDVAGVIWQSREIARSNDVQFREVDSVQFASTPKSGSPVELEIDGRTIVARTVVFAAGCGNIQFMDTVHPTHGYKVQQTPLFLARTEPHIQVPVLYDRVHELSISAHPPSEQISRGCMVIGASNTSRLVDPYSDAVGRRAVQCDEAEKLFQRISDVIPLKREQCSITAGWEPMPEDRDHILPQVIDFECGHANHQILFAFCGRATISMYAASKVLNRLGNLLDIVPSTSSTSSGEDFEEVGTEWSSIPRMHFDDEYMFSTDFRFTRR